MLFWLWEAFEGTNACLERGGLLAGKKGGAVAVKVAKENHDLRFDIPCIGHETIQVCVKAGIKVLVLESGKTVLLERNEVEQTAGQNGITIATIGSDQTNPYER